MSTTSRYIAQGNTINEVLKEFVKLPSSREAIVNLIAENPPALHLVLSSVDFKILPIETVKLIEMKAKRALLQIPDNTIEINGWVLTEPATSTTFEKPINITVKHKSGAVHTFSKCVVGENVNLLKWAVEHLPKDLKNDVNS